MAMTMLQLNLECFRKTPADSAALEGIVRQAALSEPRQQNIDAMLTADP